MTDLETLRQCLDILERQEAALLAWGDADGFFRKEDIDDVIREFSPALDPDQVREDLLNHAMLLQVPVPGHGRVQYRTRMGQTAHLLRSLRQWMRRQTLVASRTLVSDFRFMRRQRGYPEWKYGLDDLIREEAGGVPISATLKDALAALLKAGDGKRALAKFQWRATLQILRAWKRHSLNPRNQTGTIVCAGTGCGKTLAFYLPAMASLAHDLCEDSAPRVRVLAIYPRNELLKDQFMEAFQQCRKLDAFLEGRNARKLRIGALFSDTPQKGAWTLKDLQEKGKSTFRFGTMKCPKDGCKGELIWSRKAMETESQHLVCECCHHSVGADQIAVSRTGMVENPPDILFTSTEMLNQNLGNHWLKRLFGIDVGKGPTLVLLDEVHTYGGNSGAQTAYMLRRWMHRSGCHPHFVGLSATLADASAFFSELVSAKPGEVVVVEPAEKEMIPEGAEYLMVLRGDPVSQTALLSTTIQATMLLERTLDDTPSRSGQTWGSKTFVFADDLDVVNRLFGQIADAEGYDLIKGKLRARSDQPLAALRFDGPEDPWAKVSMGQDWSALADVRPHSDPRHKLRLGRTSSQDAGMDPNADVVVATASLEVGVNDTAVGCVIQHKAPRGTAAYLQRKGRAGRLRGMRPWMVVVLSQYGRDRVQFQRYEELQSPVIKRQRLPMQNIHIQKMQAALATLEWLSLKLGRGSIWSILNKPQGKDQDLERLKVILNDLLVGGDRARQEWTKYLHEALQIDPKDLEMVLWSFPRSLMLECIPTLLRRIATQWSEDGLPWAALQDKWGSPLPEFIPAALFSDLNVPEVRIQHHGWPAKTPMPTLPFFQALREYAPGRISKRYAVENETDAHWLVPLAFDPKTVQSGICTFDIGEGFGPPLYVDSQVDAPDGTSLPIYRPTLIKPGKVPARAGITEKSNSQLNWNSCFKVREGTQTFEPAKGPWDKHLKGITLCLHQEMQPLEILRYNSGAKATLKPLRGRPWTVDFQWSLQGQPAAIGCRMWVDALCLSFQVQDSDLVSWCGDPELSRALRPACFRHLLEGDSRFQGDAFQSAWAAECFLALLAERMAQGLETGAQALAWCCSEEGGHKLLEVPQTLFQSDEDNPDDQEQRLQRELRERMGDPEIFQALCEASRVLFGPPGQWFQHLEWLRSVLGNTLGAALQQSLFVLLPDVDERSINIDSYWEGDSLQVWLSEVEPGGSGVVVQWAEAYWKDPLRVLGAFISALGPSDYEQIDHDLFYLLSLASGQHADVVGCLANIRSAGDPKERQKAARALHRVLKDRGFNLSESFMAVMNSRILLPDSSAATDAELFELSQNWRVFEASTDLEWPLNLMAHTLAQPEREEDLTDAWKFQRSCHLLGRLWARGSQVRQSELTFYSPFASGVCQTERLLAAPLMMDSVPEVEAGREGWLQATHEVLRAKGQAKLLVLFQRKDELPNLLVSLQVTPLDYLGLVVYPRLSQIKRWREHFVLHVELAEMVH